MSTTKFRKNTYLPELARLALPEKYEREVGVYWKPTPEFVSELVEFLGNRKVLEVFSGNGYLAAQLLRHGIDVKATTVFSGHDAHHSGLYFDVEELDAEGAVETYGKDRDVLLLCWPTVTEAALRTVALWGEEKDIVFIGEITDYSKNQLGGCATDAFFEHVWFSQQFLTYQGSAYEAALVGRFCKKTVALNRELKYSMY